MKTLPARAAATLIALVIGVGSPEPAEAIPFQTPSSGSRPPVARARVRAVLAERDLVPEGTAFDPASGTVFLSSLNKHKIVALAPDGTVRDFIPSGAHGLRSMVGLHVDPARGTLWAASDPRYDQPSDSTPAILFGFDPATGALKGRYPAPPPGPHFLNDMTTGPDGAVYVTDTRQGTVYELAPGDTVLRRFTVVGAMRGTNGITVSSDGRLLFVAHSSGIRVVSLPDHRAWDLAGPDSVSLGPIDGLAYADGALIAHHIAPESMIARHPLSPDGRRVTGQERIESGTPDVQTSTTGEIVGDRYVFVGNSQIDLMNDHKLDSARMAPIRIYEFPLHPPPAGVVAVALSARDSVAFFDPITLARLGAVAVGKTPHEIAAGPDGRRAFVADAGDTTISVIEILPRPRLAATWPLPDSIRAHDVAVGADGTVWAASAQAQAVLRLDTRSGRITRRLRLTRPGGWMIEAGSADGRLVVANLEGGAVTLLDPGTGAETVLATAEGEIDAAPSPDGGTVWSVNSHNGLVTVHDLASGTVRAHWRSGAGAGRIRFTPDARLALTVNTEDSTVVAWDPRTFVRVGTVTVSAGPKVIAVSADGRRAYLTHPDRGNLTLLDLASMTVLATVAVPGAPDGVAVVDRTAGR